MASPETNYKRDTFYFWHYGKKCFCWENNIRIYWNKIVQYIRRIKRKSRNDKNVAEGKLSLISIGKNNFLTFVSSSKQKLPTGKIKIIVMDNANKIDQIKCNITRQNFKVSSVGSSWTQAKRETKIYNSLYKEFENYPIFIQRVMTIY